MTPVASALVSFTLIAVDRASNEIEAPFEYTPNDTPMTALSRGIELVLREMLDQRRPLPAVAPVEGIVY
jgi:putative membrane protein